MGDYFINVIIKEHLEVDKIKWMVHKAGQHSTRVRPAANITIKVIDKKGDTIKSTDSLLKEDGVIDFKTTTQDVNGVQLLITVIGGNSITPIPLDQLLDKPELERWMTLGKTGFLKLNVKVSKNDAPNSEAQVLKAARDTSPAAPIDSDFFSFLMDLSMGDMLGLLSQGGIIHPNLVNSISKKNDQNIKFPDTSKSQTQIEFLNGMIMKLIDSFKMNGFPPNVTVYFELLAVVIAKFNPSIFTIPLLSLVHSLLETVGVATAWKDITASSDISYVYPKNEDDLRHFVLQAKKENKVIRVSGSGHSFPSEARLAQNGSKQKVNLLLSNDFWQEIVQFPSESNGGIVRVRAGIHLGTNTFKPLQSELLLPITQKVHPYYTAYVTNQRVGTLNLQLWEHGYALPDMGGIDHQTVAGFLATGSAGGSLKFSLDKAIMSIRFIDGNGNWHTVRRPANKDDDSVEARLFYGVGVSMGLLGIVTEVEFQCVHAFNISGTEKISDADKSFQINFFGVPDYQKTYPKAVSLEEYFKLDTSQYSRLMWYPEIGVNRLVNWTANKIPKDPAFRPIPYSEIGKYTTASVANLSLQYGAAAMMALVDLIPCAVQFFKTIGFGQVGLVFANKLYGLYSYVLYNVFVAPPSEDSLSALDVSPSTSSTQATLSSPEKPKSKTKADKSKSDKRKSEKTKTDKMKTDKMKTDKTKTDETKTDETKTDETKTDETKTDETKTDETKTDEPKTDETKTDETKTDKSKTDKSKTEKPKTEKSKTEKSKTEKKQTKTKKKNEKDANEESEDLKGTPAPQEAKYQIFQDYSWNGLPMDNTMQADDIYKVYFTEIWIPLEQATKSVQVLQEYFGKDSDNPVLAFAKWKKTGIFAIEYYCAAASDFWLSPAYGRDVFRVDVYWFAHSSGNIIEFYDQFWRVFIEKGIECRFHWGKYLPTEAQNFVAHGKSHDWPTYIAKSYPKWEQWHILRDQLDPDQIFLTDYWSNKLSIPVDFTNMNQPRQTLPLLDFDYTSLESRIEATTGRAPKVYSPDSIDNLIDIMQELVHTEGTRFRAVGTKYGFSDVSFSERLIDMGTYCNMVYDDVDREKTLKDSVNKDNYVRTQAGATMLHIMNFLWPESARAQGLIIDPSTNKPFRIPKVVVHYHQLSLGGLAAVSANGDGVAKGPICDYVKSIHLVTVNEYGRVVQYIIEPTDGITDKQRFAQRFPRKRHNDTPFELIQDDDVFYSAVVSMGSFGIVYSMVLEVEPAFFVRCIRSVAPWDSPTTKEALRSLVQGNFDKMEKGDKSTHPDANDGFMLSLNPYDTDWNSNPVVGAIRTQMNGGNPPPPLPVWGRYVAWFKYIKEYPKTPEAIAIVRSKIAEYQWPLSFSFQGNVSTMAARFAVEIAKLGLDPNLQLNTIAPLLNAFVALTNYPPSCVDTVNDPTFQLSIGPSESIPADAAEVFSVKGVDPDGKQFVDFIDRCLNVLNDIYNISDTKTLKGSLQCTLIVLVYLMHHSPHYLSPSYNAEKKASVAVELGGMTGYFDTVKWLNTFVDKFDQGEVKPFWAYRYGKYNKETVRSLYPRFDDFLKNYKRFNPKGYFSNQFTERFFDEKTKKN